MKRKTSWQISFMAFIGAVSPAMWQTAEAVPYGMYFEERGHLNEVREDAGPVEIAILHELGKINADAFLHV